MMLASTIALLLILVLVSLFVDLKIRYAVPTGWRRWWRPGSYLVLMLLGPLTACFYLWQIKPAAAADRLVIQGQYFPQDKTIQISGDPSNADYLVPGLLVHDKDDEDVISENPLIELHYEEKDSTIKVVATGTARPILLNNKFKNVTALAPQSEIKVGQLTINLVRGWLSSRFVINGASYPLSWPRAGDAVSLSKFLCAAGFSDEAQAAAIGQPPQRPENPLTHLWLISSGGLGLINGNIGDSVNITVNDQKLESKWLFDARNQDSLTYRTGRRAVTLKIEVDPAKKQIYLIPEKPLDFPLYHDPGNERSEIRAFLASGPSVSTPAYQLSLGDKNRDLVNAAIKYSFDPEAVGTFASELSAEDREHLKHTYQSGFIVNNGVSQKEYKFADTALVGSSDGGVLIKLLRKEVSVRHLVLILVLIWSVAMVLFAFYGGIKKGNYLFVLMPLVHFLLAIRLILSYRGYVLPPNLSESYEKALLAAIFVPFAIFVWLSPKALSDPFQSGYTDSERRRFSSDWYMAWKKFIQHFIRIPAFIYTLVCLLLIYVVSGLWNGLMGMFSILAFFVGSLIAARFLAAASDDADRNPLLDWVSNERRFDIWILFGFPAVLAFFLKVFGLGAESLPLLSLRAELLYLPFLLLGACRLYGRFFRLHFAVGGAIRWFDYFQLVVPVGCYFLQALIVGDFGFLVYSVPVFFLALVITWRAEQNWSGWQWFDRRVLLSGLLLSFSQWLNRHFVSYAVLFASLTAVALLLWSPFFTERLKNASKGSSFEGRVFAFESTGRLQDLALETKDEPRESVGQKFWHVIGWGTTPSQCDSGINARRTLETHEHFWTMFHFAARGARGVGYGNAPIGRVPFPNGIAQSDNTYSIYIMSEHGSLGALAVISLYLVFGFLLLFVLTQHFAGDVAATLLVGGMTMTILFSAFYHAAGNVGAVPFTGRNLPLLSLNSNADILLVGFLLAIALSVISNQGEDLGGTDTAIRKAFTGAGTALNQWIGVIAALLLAFFVVLSVKTMAMANNTDLQGDYDLKQVLEATQRHLDANEITWDPAKKEILANEAAIGLAKGQYLRQLIQKFNAATADDKQSGRYFFLAPNLTEDLNGATVSGLTYSKNYFRRASPFSTRTVWTGGLRSSDSADGNQDCLSSNGIALFFIHLLDRDDPIPDPKAEDVIWLPAPGSTSLTKGFNRRFSVKDQKGSLLFDAYAIEGDTVLEHGVNKHIRINGNEVLAKRVRLDDGDVVAVGDSSPATQSFTFFYQRAASSAILTNRWVNGRVEFYYPQGEAFALARPIAEAINAQVGKTQPSGPSDLPNRSLTMSLDAGLNNEIYRVLKNDGEDLWAEINDRTGDRPQVSVTAMNPLTGEILALASWPSFDPNHLPREKEKRDAQSYTNLLKHNDQLFLLNHNFTRHIMGSATKPFIASAAASLHPELLGLTVVDDRKDYDNVFGIKTGRTLWHSKGNAEEYDWNKFLVHSDNLYEVMLGFLGVSKPGPIQFTNIRSEQNFSLRGEKNRQPEFAGVFEPGTGKAHNLDQSPLASTLVELFDIGIKGPDADYMTQVWQTATGMLPESGNTLKFISPERPNLNLDLVTSARDFVSVCLGGFTNRWSNVKSVESFSRLVTGRRVVATMLKTDSSPTFEPLPLNSDVRRALLKSLQGVCTEGTASQLATKINEIRRGDDRFTIFAKTGTLPGLYRSGRNDSNIILLAGLWDPTKNELSKAVALSVYVQKGNKGDDSGRATILAGKILDILRARGQWTDKRVSNRR
jgi:hypothetical protein